MKDDPIPQSDHISRYCSFSYLTEDKRPTQVAFYLNGDDCVSVNWLEHCGLSTRLEQLEAVRNALTSKGLILRKSGRLAVLNVGDIVASTNHQIIVSHQPELPHDPSHSGIYYPLAEQAFVEFLASRVAERVLESHAAVTIV